MNETRGLPFRRDNTSPTDLPLVERLLSLPLSEDRGHESPVERDNCCCCPGADADNLKSRWRAIDPAGLGVAAAGNTIQNVTIVAKQ
jgi:hypothetical protein